MIESPLIQELLQEVVTERGHKTILIVLKAGLGAVPQDMVTARQLIQDNRKLDDLLGFAATCRDLDAFRARLQS